MYQHIHRRAVLLLLIFGMIMLAGTHLAVEQIRKQAISSLEQTLSSILFTTHELTRYWLEQHSRIARTAEVRKATVELLQHPAQHNSDQLSHAQLQNYLSSQLALLDDFTYTLIAPNGMILSASDTHLLGKPSPLSVHQPEKLAASLNGSSLLIPLRNEGPEAAGNLWLALPVKDSDGYTLAVLAVSGDISERLSRMTRWSLFGHSGETYLFDQHATQLTASRFGRILVDQTSMAQSQFALRLPGSNASLTHMASSALAGINSQGLEKYRDYRGVEVLGVWFWNTRLNMGIATEIDAQEGLAGFYQSRNLLWGITGLLLLLSATFTGFMLHQQNRVNRHQRETRRQLEEQVELRTRDLHEARLALEQSNEKLQQLAITDGLTGLANRRHLDEHLANEWQRCSREGQLLAVILLDIDLFKHYNDNYGHQHGDICLKAVAACLSRLQGAQRPGDLIARYGGEEFVLILSNTDPEYVLQLAQQARIAIEALRLKHPSPVDPQNPVVTTSVGASCAYPNPASTPHELIKAADLALYRAKHQGRNQVVMNPPGTTMEVS